MALVYGSGQAFGVGSTSGSAVAILSGTGSISGVGSASGTGALTKSAQVTADIVFGAEAEATEPGIIPRPSGVVPSWNPIDNLSPASRVEVGGLSDLSVNNRLRVLGSGNLEIDPTYSGAAYTFEGPANDSVSPKKLGYKRGDKIKLIGPVGGEPYDGTVLTIQDPVTLGVFEKLDPSDTTLYQFFVFRSVS